MGTHLAQPQPAVTLAADLERRRLAMRERRLERVLAVLRLRADMDGSGGHEARRQRLRHSIQEFERELDSVREALGGRFPSS